MILTLVHYLYGIIVVAILSCSAKKQASSPKGTDTGNVVADTRSAVVASQPVAIEQSPQSKSAVSTRAGEWLYKETVGKTGTKIYTASVVSADVLKFAPPFNGGSTVTLALRKRNGSVTVLLEVSAGQFTSSFLGGKVRIQFDNSAPALYSFSAAGDGRTDIIFLDSTEPLIAKLKASRKTVINVGFYGQGTRRVEFKTAGLKWNG